MKDHTESIQIDFDPQHITYLSLLELFFQSHAPFGSSRSVQYRSAIFYHDQEQQEQAAAMKAQFSEQHGGRIVSTDLEPFTSFTLAEDYHQKYYLQKHGPLMAAMGLSKKDWLVMTHCPLATKVNAYVDGRGSRKQARAFCLAHETATFTAALIDQMVVKCVLEE